MTKSYRTIILFMVLSQIIGCVPSLNPIVVENAIEHARINYESLKDVEEAQKQYPDDLQFVYNKYFGATKYWNAGQKEKAYSDALESIKVSQKILAELARRSMVIIENILKDDPDNPLRKFLPKLNEILLRAEKIDSGEATPSVGQFLNDLAFLEQLPSVIKSCETPEIIGDIVFALGKYELSKEGQEIIENKILQNIVTAIEERIEQFPNKTINVTIRVVGYTDQVDFKKGTNLLLKLTEGIEGEIPQDEIGRRQLLN